MFRKVLFTVAASALCMAQRVWLGGEVGARTTADVSGSADSESRWYVAGPSLSVELGAVRGVCYRIALSPLRLSNR
ncbi:MAG: hypothetical protein U0Q16_11540 [Bryobacteraceae bacterium]